MIFEVTPAHIEDLSDTDLRTLVGYLAEREVSKAGCSPSAVTYGGHQNAKDGGIDVRVDLKEGKIGGYVPRLATGFQAKAENFAAADIKKEMRPKGKLRESIRALGEAGGAYIIVASKGSVSDPALKSRTKAMADAISDEPSAASLVVDFYDKRRIASWVNQHPGIIPWVRERVGQPISGWRPFQDWSSSPSGEGASYILDDGIRLFATRQNDAGLSAEDGINLLRAIVREPRGVIRLLGLSGVGKTRMVQALFDDRIGGASLDPRLAVYADIGDSLDPVPAELLSNIQGSGQRCILIVDNCGAELHHKLAARLSANSEISLITVEYDINDDEPENTEVFKLMPASKDVIEKILTPRFPELAEPEVRTIAEFSEGNFRVALALANTATGGQSLANLKDGDLFNRLFRQKKDDDPALLRTAKVCSLVYSFDGVTTASDEAELPLLAVLAGQSVLEFHANVVELKRRQLIQARSRWRAFLPHALAHRLAKLALDDIPFADIKALTDAAGERLLKSLSRRIGCLHDNAPAQMLADDWLSIGGKVADVGRLNQLEMTILENIAPVHPKAVLVSIETAAASRSDFFDANLNADGLVRLLRALAYEPSLFADAAILIARFARSKTESNNSSDAVNVFKSLFYRELSGTHAPAKVRADFIRRLAVQAGEEDQALVLSALDAMLECAHFSSSYGFEFGTRKRDYGFHAKTWDEQSNWYSEVFGLARDIAANATLRDRVRSMIAAQFRFLVLSVRLDDLIALAEHFADDGGWPEGWAGVRGALRVLKKDEDGDECVQKLAGLEVRLEPNSLSQRIASYVTPSQWGMLDLADLDFEDEQRYEKMLKKIEAVCDGIGAELAADSDRLREHMPKLLQSTSERVNSVARAIGRTTKNPEDLWGVIEQFVLAQENEGTVFSFPGSFLAGLAEKDRATAEQLLNAKIANPHWHRFIPHMQRCIGLDGAGCKRLIELISLPSLPAWTLHTLAHGNSTVDLTGSDFKGLLAAIAQKEGGLDAATEILYMRLYSFQSEKKPITDVEREVAVALLEQVTFDRKKNHEAHWLAEIVCHCLAHPADDQLARRLCQRLLAAIGAYKVSPYDYAELFTEIAGVFPRIALDEALEPDGGEKGDARGLLRPFREGQPYALRKINDEVLLEWAREKPNTRFIALASQMIGWSGPKAGRNLDFPDEGDVSGLKWTPVALRLIHESPDPISVLEAFAEQFMPSGWSGSLAVILAGRQSLLAELSCDPNTRISEWAKAAIPKLEKETEHRRRWEEERYREHDERFDW